ncbi:MAG TPA: redoxin domain-containing protein [Dongiaceae bacterium]|jgi:hypothetical protein|nr:redoxin domain-containing protein [Dongiaceae bacterium]
MLRPGISAPGLKFATVAHGAYDLAADAPANGTLLAFYRGGHSRTCGLQLKELDDHIGDLAIRAVRVVAVSADSAERAAETVSRMQIIRLPVGYGIDVERARSDWGLYVSLGRPASPEPAIFSEPALFWIRRGGAVAFCTVSSTPQLRPTATQLVRAIDDLLREGGEPPGSYTEPCSKKA